MSDSRKSIGLVAGLAIVAALACGGAAAWLAVDRGHLQEQLASTSNQLSSVQQQLGAAEVALKAKDAAIAKRDSALAGRDAALAGRDAALVEASKPEVPVGISFRKALTGTGMVATIRNLSKKTITVIAAFRDPNVDTGKDFTLAIDSERASEIGYAEGWPVASGQTLLVRANGYKPVTAVAP